MWTSRLRRALAGSGLGLVTALAACDERTAEVETQASMHTTGEVGEPRAPWLWANETLDEFASAQSFPPAYLPLDHPMTARLQLWVTEIDRALRDQLPGRLEGTPPPNVLVLFTRELDAQAHRIDVAFDVPGRAATAPSDLVADAPSSLVLQPSGVVFGGRDGSPAPLARPASAATIRDFVSFFTDGTPSCRVEGDEHGITFGPGCRFVGAPVASRVGFSATSRFVTVTTGLLAEVADEGQVLAILAHELGHYYRAHLSAPTDRLNYLYALDGDRGTRPAPDPRFERETAGARALARSAPTDITIDALDRLMTERRLGLYTTEQEADEVSVELLARVGMPPTVAVDAILATQKLVEERTGRVKGVSWAECASLREQGFRDHDGAEVAVPIGSIEDAHHSFCFRAQNLQREILAHRYPLSERPRPPGPSWATLVADL